MSYHIFPNLREIIQGDLVSKLRKGIAYKHSIDRKFNCNLTTKVNGMCAYRGECSRLCVVYKLKCEFCGDFYNGNTLNTLKITEQKFQGVDQKVMNNKNLEYFAIHFAKHFTKKTNLQECRKTN